MVKLFVVGFPRDMDEVELTDIFAAYGEVSGAKIITDQQTGESQGYGFVDMVDQIGADAAVAGMDGAAIDDRLISVRIREDKSQLKKVYSTTQKRSARPQAQRRAKQQQQQPVPGKKKRPRL